MAIQMNPVTFQSDMLRSCIFTRTSNLRSPKFAMDSTLGSSTPKCVVNLNSIRKCCCIFIESQKISPSRQASVFVKSYIRAHVELKWLLSFTTPIGWLDKMIQFKERSLKAVFLVGVKQQIKV